MRHVLRSTFAVCLVAAALATGCAGTAPETARVAGPAAAEPTMAVSTGWLAAHLEDEDVVVLHVDKEAGSYQEGHVPGARFVALGDIVVEREGTPNEIPGEVVVVSTFEDAGVSDDTHVVLYGGLDGLAAARAMFTLAWLGHDDASLLDGGLARWKADGHPVETGSRDALVGDITAETRPELVVSTDWVAEHRTREDVALVDARPEDHYTGETPGDGVERAGHIPGARSFFWKRALTDGEAPVLKDPQRIWEMWTDGLDVGPESTVVTYCRTGVQASYAWFLARFLGMDAKLYDASYIEWSGREDLPVE
ncbi:MAG: sulfurtransferase [Myxococcota bacterium]